MSSELSTSGTNDQEILLLRQEVASLRATLEAERASSALKIAEQERTITLLEAAIQQCPVPIVIVTAPGLVVKCRNQAALDILSISPSPLGGAHLEHVLAQKTWEDLRLDGTPKPIDELPLTRALRGCKTLGEQAIVRRADGTERWINVSAVPVCDEDGQVIAALLVFPDITARKEAEESIKNAQERLELALDGADLGIWDWDVASGTVSYDRRWAQMLGYPSEELDPTLHTWERLVHPDDFAMAQCTLKDHLEGRTSTLEFEHRLRHRDGSWVWVLSKGRVCERDRDGVPLRVAGTHLNVTQRKQEELARREAEREAQQRAEEVRSLLESMSNSFVMWRTKLDDHGKVTDAYFEYFNAAYARIAGFALEQVQGKSVLDVWPDTEQSWLEVCGEVLRTGMARYFEMAHSATHRYYACHAYRPPNAADRICMVFDDITEQRDTVNKLRELAGQQKAILNAAPVGISFVKDRNLQWANPELARMLGYRLGELQNAPARELYLHQHDYDRVGREGYQHLVSGGVYSTEALFKKEDGSSIWGHLTGQAVDAQAPEKGSIWTFQDITENRLAEMTLRESELRFKRLVQNSSDIIAVTDAAGAFLSVSDSATRILGYEVAELVGANAFDFIHADDREAATTFFNAIASRPDAPIRAEYRCRHKNGNWVALEVVGTNLLYDPSVKGIVQNLRDISERNRLNEQLQQAMKMEAVGRLAGGIAHDFNNLLTVISGSIELLKMDLEPVGCTPGLLDEAAAAAHSAATLTRQLLAFSRRQMIEPRVLDLNELVQELHKLLTRIIGEDITMKTTPGPNLGAVRVDPGQFEQVLVNLVVNARDAMPQGGALLIETSNVELDATYQKL
ncbi:MAG TPA: PAS domain S-box protein, partial [Polyangiaceae bacterium]|nr:PAS domain S-box protein [Polyangiaceae bacterium]